jgi:hypothetical protein
MPARIYNQVKDSLCRVKVRIVRQFYPVGLAAGVHRDLDDLPPVV